MSLSNDCELVLAAAVEHWFENFTGTSALDVASQLSKEHGAVMAVFEELRSLGYGTLNANVGLVQLSFDPDNPQGGFKQEPVTTHIFFPSKEALYNAFYASDRPKRRLPEYETRLHLGAHQLALVYFREEVLKRYFSHPELYDVRDSLAGGELQPAAEAPEECWLDVKYGKCRLKTGRVAVTAIYKDLGRMSPAEQRHWHSHEVEGAEPDRTDAHFQSFLRRTYDGSWAEFDDPIERLTSAIDQVNAAFGSNAFYLRSRNVHLQLPVEETYKSYCDSASELFKLVGPDNVGQSQLKAILLRDFKVPPEQLVHAESKRPLSSLQLLAKLEDALEASGIVTALVDKVKPLRVAADHKVLETDSERRSYSRQFADLCSSLAGALGQLAEFVQKAHPSRGA